MFIVFTEYTLPTLKYFCRGGQGGSRDSSKTYKRKAQGGYERQPKRAKQSSYSRCDTEGYHLNPLLSPRQSLTNLLQQAERRPRGRNPQWQEESW